MPENIFLVGPMGVGKTTIGSHLARKLKYDFVDSDTEIEKRTGASISLIFDIEGEEGFRKREAQMIEALTQKRHIVLSTGGGSVLDEISRQNLRSKGYVVYLKASVEILYERLKKSRNRPLMETDDKKKVIEDLLAEREPLYLAVADITIATDGRSAQDVAREIYNQYEKHA
ncbi:MAG: shikimate kinase AroK [Pseudomonadota bacterium]|nr:shikimate kinase AroK [Pseudomonadota bacterium]